MKKLLLIIILISSCYTNVNAQKWFEKLSKGLQTVSNVLGGKKNATGTSSTIKESSKQEKTSESSQGNTISLIKNGYVIIPNHVTSPIPEVAKLYKRSKASIGAEEKRDRYSESSDFTKAYAGVTYTFRPIGNNEVMITHSSNIGYKQGLLEMPSTITYNGRTYSVTVLGSGAVNSTDVTRINWPRNLREIHFNALQDCRFEALNIPSTVTYIGAHAFNSCTSRLKSVTIPASVTHIGYAPFFSAEHKNILQEINVDPNNPNYKSWEGVLFNKNMTELIQVPRCLSYGTYYVPITVVSINRDAFSYCDNIGNIVLPNSVKYLAVDAFQKAVFHCLIIPSSIVAVDEYALGVGNFSREHRESIVMMSETAPIINNLAFNTTGTYFKQDPIIYVPKGCRDSYLSAETWGERKTIIETSFIKQNH